MIFYGYILVTSWIKPLHWSQVLCTIVVSRVFNRRKGFRAFSQPASVPRKRPFPEHCRVFPVVRLSFCEGKNLFPHQCLSEKAVFKFRFPTKNFNDPDFYLILDFNKETHSEFPARLVSFLIQLSAAQNVLISGNFFLCVPLSHPSLHNLVLTLWPSQSPLPSQPSSSCRQPIYSFGFLRQSGALPPIRSF